MIDFIVACSYFPFPHEMADVREKVIALTEKVLPEGVEFLDKVHSAAADGASVNKCFDPNPEASGISAAEKLDRQIVKARYYRLEELTCILHRLVKLMEHVVDDEDSDASKSFKALIVAIYAFFDLINSSQKNEQALREIQDNDETRVGRTVMDITTPKTRWNYNSRRLQRVRRLWPYASVMKPETTTTTAQKLEWTQKKNSCEQALIQIEKIAPLLDRFQYWIVYFQTTAAPTVSLILYLIDDLRSVADSLADKSDREGNVEAEAILSRFLAQIEEEFQFDAEDDYLRLAQLLDPRVSYRVNSLEEINRLLDRAKTYLPRIENTAATIQPDFDEDDIWAATAVVQSVPGPAEIDRIWSDEIIEFKKAMRKVRRKITDDHGNITWEFHGGVARVQDIDVLQFYREHYQLFLHFASVIRKILGTNAASTSCERIFNYAGIVLNCRRTSLLTDMADKLIVSACRHKNTMRSNNLKLPKLPDIGVFETDATNAEEAEEHAEAVEEFWDDFLGEL